MNGKILGIESPWSVAEVDLALAAGEVRVQLVHAGGRSPCPQCGQLCPGYDERPRRWRHLDTCQYRTILMASVPRVQCPEHGVGQIRVPWGEPNSRFTALFEALVIDWLLEASVSAVARCLGLSWGEVATIQARAVRRGLERRQHDLPVEMGVAETSFQKRHEYVTVVCDRREGQVMHVADGRTREAFESYLAGFSEAERAQVESVSLDMAPSYLAAVRAQIPVFRP